MAGRRSALGKRALLLPLLLWLVVFFAGPMLWMFRQSFAYQSFDQSRIPFTTSNYQFFLGNPIYLRTLWSSLLFGAVVAVVCMLVAVPTVYFLLRHLRPGLAALLMALLLFPYLTSHVVRVVAWMSILGSNGLVNSALLRLGLIEAPLSIFLYSPWANLITVTYVNLPLMMSLVALRVIRLDSSLLEAAEDLGSTRLYRFRRVTLPHLRPGIAAGLVLVFSFSAAAYVEPRLVGGTDGVMIATIIGNFFTGSIFYERGSALAFIVLAILFVVVLAISRLVGDPRDTVALRE